MFYCIVFLVVYHVLDFTYIYFHSKLVFPGGVLSRVVLTKNTCVHFSCMLSVDIMVASGGMNLYCDL
jgi:hypothetical protein